ncbi:hypothetical protein QRD02_13170 [Aequorivita sp. SDUM287046]|uniref:Uncharacterized protein n=1 Tax=Aequorivita aurantiaca TaxID=3053356 RepID=A0ABT8DQJ3_9FLAO|nr:hypothetical protein [Aequorivita aurantiaca]MDN3725332.1 hypothetical protein [Aequorivita aurantiaca]
MRIIKYSLIALALVGCDKNDDDKREPLDGNDWDIVIPTSSNKPGIGNTEGLPIGTPWHPPQGIELVDRPNKPFDSNTELLYGSLNTFYADVNFVNHTEDTLSVEIPSGLIFIFKHEGRTQDGLLTSPLKVKVPPTFSAIIRDTTTIYVGLGCLNYTKAFPWEENQEEDTKDYPIGKDMYKPYVVTTDENLLRLLDIVGDFPNLALTEHYNPQEMFDDNYEVPKWQEIYAIIQNALWQITDGPGLLLKDYRELLEALEPYR